MSGQSGRAAPPPLAVRVAETAATLATSAAVKLAELVRETLWSPALLAADLHYAWIALGRSPYRAGGFQQHLLARRRGGPRDEYLFGETPWFTARRLLRRVGLRAGEHLVDLGAGDGRVVLYAALRFGARATGYEIITERHQQALRVLAARCCDGVSLVCGDGFAADLADTDVLYCAWTCFSPESRRRMGGLLEVLRPGARLVTVTHPIDDPRVDSLGAERAWFGWGRCDVYFYRRR